LSFVRLLPFARISTPNTTQNSPRRAGHPTHAFPANLRLDPVDPKLIAKYQRRFPDFDDKIISMYARGMSVREIRGHLEELYGIDVSAQT
jgi:transposase-like protein